MSDLRVWSDMHVGNKLGINPPCLRSPLGTAARAFQDETWGWFVDENVKCGPIDVLAINADIIDGKGRKSGGTELLTSDRFEQVELAVEIVKIFKPKTIVATFGTPYHTGEDEDWEAVFASMVQKEPWCKHVAIQSQIFPRIDGVTIDLKHEVSRSSVPYGQFTPAAKEGFWNKLWSIEGRKPSAQVVMRGHIHKYTFCGDHRQICITLPALQGAGTKFGSRRCSGLVDFGFLSATCEKGVFSWQAHILVPESEKVHPLFLDQYLGRKPSEKSSGKTKSTTKSRRDTKRSN